MTLDAIEFIRRFLLHVLPSGLVRIRQFGFLANRVRKHKLELCRTLLRLGPPSAPTDAPSRAGADLDDPQRCPICQVGRLVLIELFTAELILIQDTS